MWRRGRRIGHHLAAVLDAMEQGSRAYAYLFLTLTVRSCDGYWLGSCLDDVIGGFHKLVKYRQVAPAVLGWFRSLEITHNLDRKSRSFDTYHPHIHAVLAVGDDYFGHNYISRDEWLRLWRRAARDEKITQVDVRRIYAKDGVSIGAAVAEAAKYAVKDSDYCNIEDKALARRTVAALDDALFHRRLVAFGGVMKDCHAALNLVDAETEDIEPCADDEGEYIGRRVFVWCPYRQDYFSKD
jgi:plasmid rolling circle replication initiator protein Rep